MANWNRDATFPSPFMPQLHSVSTTMVPEIVPVPMNPVVIQQHVANLGRENRQLREQNNALRQELNEVYTRTNAFRELWRKQSQIMDSRLSEVESSNDKLSQKSQDLENRIQSLETESSNRKYESRIHVLQEELNAVELKSDDLRECVDGLASNVASLVEQRNQSARASLVFELILKAESLIREEVFAQKSKKVQHRLRCWGLKRFLKTKPGTEKNFQAQEHEIWSKIWEDYFKGRDFEKEDLATAVKIVRETSNVIAHVGDKKSYTDIQSSIDEYHKDDVEALSAVLEFVSQKSEDPEHPLS